jgi:hypothetical protein
MRAGGGDPSGPRDFLAPADDEEVAPADAARFLVPALGSAPDADGATEEGRLGAMTKCETD